MGYGSRPPDAVNVSRPAPDLPTEVPFVTALLRLAAVAMLVSACTGSAVAAPAEPVPTPLTVYVTPAPTPTIVYLTPATTDKARPKPAARPAPRSTPRPAPTPSDRTLAYERLIRAHVPGSFRSTCVHTTTLPPLAVAGLDCSPRGAVVADVGYYLFQSQTDMNAAFFNRMATYHVRSGSGNCWAGIIGEGFYRFTYTGQIGGHVGCFVDSSGHASIRWTTDDLLIYAGATGKSRSIARVTSWWNFQAGPFEYS
jgi:hypothetical protein